MSLTAEAVSVLYGQRLAVDRVSISFSPGSLVGLIGPNGAGKSSLLKAICGLVTYHGHITWAGEHISAMTTDRRARTIAYLSQAPAAHWPLPAASLVELGRLPHRRFGEKVGASDRTAVRSALIATGTSQLAERRMSELSGGEFARVQLARALCVGAPALLVDEPTARLDPYHQLHIMSALKRYTKERKLVVAVLHDLTLAARFCDRIVLIDHGRVAACGAPRSVLTAETLRAIYGVEVLITEHEGQLVVVPWRQCRG